MMFNKVLNYKGIKYANRENILITFWQFILMQCANLRVQNHQTHGDFETDFPCENKLLKNKETVLKQVQWKIKKYSFHLIK